MARWNTLGKVCGSVAVMALVQMACYPAQAGLVDDFASFFNSSDKDMSDWMAQPQKAFKWGDWDYVQVVAREGAELGKPNQHPAQLSAEQAAQVLISLTVKASDGPVRLFTDEEVQRLAPTLAAGLAKATDGQDFVFRTSSRHQVVGPFGQKLVNTGRIFVADGELNVIIGLQLSEALLGLHPGMKPALRMDPGTRAKQAAHVDLLTPADSGLRALRADWIAMPLAAIKVGPQVAALLSSSAGAAKPAASTAVALPAASPNAAAAATAPAPAAKAPAVAATTPEPAVAGAMSKQEERLRLLRRLYDNGLISESEYQQKRAEVLKDL